MFWTDHTGSGVACFPRASLPAGERRPLTAARIEPRSGNISERVIFVLESRSGVERPHRYGSSFQ
jgi:hypothetical protein